MAGPTVILRPTFTWLVEIRVVANFGANFGTFRATCLLRTVKIQAATFSNLEKRSFWDQHPRDWKKSGFWLTLATISAHLVHTKNSFLKRVIFVYLVRTDCGSSQKTRPSSGKKLIKSARLKKLSFLDSNHCYT